MSSAKSYQVPEYWQNFWQSYADAFIAPLKSNDLLGKFVKNSAVTGSYGEAWVRSMVRNMLPQFRISTGAVIRPSDQTRSLRSVPQCDLIIWDPSELPALFEQGEFALVPTHAVHAIIEIKRKCPDMDGLTEQLQACRKLLRIDCRSNLLGVVIENPKPLFPQSKVKPDWLNEAKWETECATVALLSQEMAPHNEDIMAFIFFLSQVAGHFEVAA